MANEQKLTTMGQMKAFAQQQDARDDAQEEKIRQLDEDNDTVLRYTSQNLSAEQQEQARENIGVTSITTEQIDAILAT